MSVSLTFSVCVVSEVTLNGLYAIGLFMVDVGSGCVCGGGRVNIIVVSCGSGSITGVSVLWCPSMLPYSVNVIFSDPIQSLIGCVSFCNSVSIQFFIVLQTIGLSCVDSICVYMY